MENRERRERIEEEPDHFEADRRDRGPRDRDFPPRERNERLERVERNERDRERERPERKANNPFASIKLERGDNDQLTVTSEVGESQTNSIPDERDVLSLSSLVKEQPKKTPGTNGKAPSPENVKSLRDVLSSILKKDGAEDTAHSTPKTAPDAAPQEARENAKSEAREDRAGDRRETAHEPHRPDTSDTKDSSQKSQASHGAPHRSEPFIDASPREVPEDVLKKVLSMEERK
jgi:hypothetical protein